MQNIFLFWGVFPFLSHGLLSTESIAVGRKFSGSGLHRVIETNINVPEKLQKHLAVSDCSLLMLQELPAGVYADPFQLKSLRLFGFPKFLFDRQVNIEAAEYASRPHELYLYIDVHDYLPDKVAGHLSIDLSLPVHGRYHRPLPWGSNSEPQAKVSVLHPGLYSNCSQADEHNIMKAPCDVSNSSLCDWAHVSYIRNSPQIEITIPVGQERHKPLVVTVTLLVTAVICALLCNTIFTAHTGNKDKES